MKIRYEPTQLESLFTAASPLFQSVRTKKPDYIETVAYASTLHSFYTGIESVFILIAKSLSEDLPQDENWHKRILEQMSKNTERRAPIIQKKTAEQLL